MAYLSYKSGSWGRLLGLEILPSKGDRWLIQGLWIGYLSELKTVLMKQGGTPISSAPSMGVYIHHLAS